MKKLTYVFIILSLCLCALMLSSCEKTYDITYELNGGEIGSDNPAQYKEGETIKLGIAKKKDHAFLGWYADPEFEELVTEINDTMGDITLYARWIKTEHALTFKLVNSNSSNRYFQLVECDKRVQYVEIPTTYMNYRVSSIGASAFAGCEHLQSVVIPVSVYSIPDYAFSGCNSLEEVVLGNGINSIGNGAFYGCDSLKKITFSETTTSIGESAFGKCASLETITIPNGVKEIGKTLFMGCTSLKEINIGDKAAYISEKAFRECPSLEAINVSEGNEKYMSIDGVLYSKDGTTLIRYPQGKKDKSFTVPEGVSVIGSYAFSDNPYIENVTLPDSVISIKAIAFGDCVGLKKINIPSSVTEIGTGAFCNCPQLPDSLKSK